MGMIAEKSKMNRNKSIPQNPLNLPAATMVKASSTVNAKRSY